MTLGITEEIVKFSENSLNTQIPRTGCMLFDRIRKYIESREVTVHEDSGTVTVYLFNIHPISDYW